MGSSAVAVGKVSKRTKANEERDGSVRRSALTAGIGILMIAALAVFANFLVLEKLVTPGNPARTATDILASKGLFQLGIASWILIAALDVLVAGALFRVVSPVSRGLATVATWSRVVYGAVLVIAVTRLIEALRLLGDHASPGSSSVLQVQAFQKVQAFTDLWNAGLVLFGIHLLLVGYLAYRSAYMPKFIGAVVAIAGFGYLFDTASKVLFGDSVFSLSVITGLGEFALALWLVIRGRRISLPPVAQQEQGPLDRSMRPLLVPAS